MVSNTRLYGAAVGVASGGYSVVSATTASRMVTAGWLMLVVGAVALVHGLALLTPAADRIGDASGPLMAVYALTMLAIQVAWLRDSSPTGAAWAAEWTAAWGRGWGATRWARPWGAPA
ncbi:hypothetical protein [Haloparvum sedimenti]|uniref:hypothetical protein n=1 Tax=Haloparvum sedimenti TaxID=1678448 RepID=UPI001C3FFDB2|nr:hypothetical protein [Haloparvum sedimenti]